MEGQDNFGPNRIRWSKSLSSHFWQLAVAFTVAQQKNVEFIASTDVELAPKGPEEILYYSARSRRSHENSCYLTAWPWLLWL